MGNLCMENIKGYYRIENHEDYIIFHGDSLVIFKKDGTLVANRKDLRNILKIVVLPNNRVLVDCGIPIAYILLSLDTGENIWKVRPPRSDCGCRAFVVSSKNDIVYALYNYRCKPYISRIMVSSGEIVSQKIRNKLRAVKDIIFDEEDRLCVLVSHYQEPSAGPLCADDYKPTDPMCFPDPAYVVDSTERISLNGIHYAGSFRPKGEYDNAWLATWEFSFPRVSDFFFGSVNAVLTEDLYVYDWKNKSSYFLLENDPNWEYPYYYQPSNYYIDSNRNLIIIQYYSVNVVIDIAARKMVARYESPYCLGCLIDDEFWTCTKENGFVRKPFPLVEDIPPLEPVTWPSSLSDLK